MEYSLALDDPKIGTPVSSKKPAARAARVTVSEAYSAAAFADCYSRMNVLVELAPKMERSDWLTLLGEWWSGCENVEFHHPLFPEPLQRRLRKLPKPLRHTLFKRRNGKTQILHSPVRSMPMASAFCYMLIATGIPSTSVSNCMKLAGSSGAGMTKLFVPEGAVTSGRGKATIVATSFCVRLWNL